MRSIHSQLPKLLLLALACCITFSAPLLADAAVVRPRGRSYGFSERVCQQSMRYDALMQAAAKLFNPQTAAFVKSDDVVREDVDEASACYRFASMVDSSVPAGRRGEADYHHAKMLVSAAIHHLVRVIYILYTPTHAHAYTTPLRRASTTSMRTSLCDALSSCVITRVLPTHKFSRRFF
jgi:hypothetical protein